MGLTHGHDLLHSHADHAPQADRKRLRGPHGDFLCCADIQHVIDPDSVRTHLADTDRFVGAHLFGAVLTDRNCLVRAHLLGAIVADRDRLVNPHLFGSGVIDRDGFVVEDMLGAVMADADALIMLDSLLPVILAVDVDQLVALGIVHRDFVVSTAALRAVGFVTGDHGSGRQPERRRLHGIVDPSGDDGTVRIALEKIDNHFLPDARDMQAAPTFARPWIADANPAGAVLVVLPLAVPEELHLHAAVLIGVNLLTRRPPPPGRPATFP